MILWVPVQDDALLDDIIGRLLAGRNARPGKQVQLSEHEMRQLCLTARDIFMSQPNLLELEAPIKICGMQHRPQCSSGGPILSSCFLFHAWTKSGASYPKCGTYLRLVLVRMLPKRRRHTRPILRPAEALRIWRLPSRSKLFISWRLRRSG